MAQTASAVGKGSLFKMGDGASPEVFTTIVEITKIGAFGEERPAVEATTLDSNIEDFVTTMLKGGTISLEGNALPDATTQGFTSGFAAAVRTGSKKNFKITLPSSLGGKSFLFTALPTKWSIGDIAPKAVVPVKFELQIVEGPAWAGNAAVPLYYA